MKSEVERMFHEDISEKKKIGTSAYKKHYTKRDVMLPSDKLSKKEIEKMNGEVYTYNIRNPMKWAEFKDMPDDIKKQYINRLRNLYGATNTALAEMFGVSEASVRNEVIRIGCIKTNKNSRTNKQEWQNFLKYGSPERVEKEQHEQIIESNEQKIECENEEEQQEVEQTYKSNFSGYFTFNGNVTDILNDVLKIIGNVNAHITVSFGEIRANSEVF
jgi:hypothetical protein